MKRLFKLLRSSAMLCIAGCSATHHSAGPTRATNSTNSFAICLTAEPTTFGATGNWSRVPLKLPPVIADTDISTMDLTGAIRLRPGVINRLPDPLTSREPATLLLGMPFVCVVNGQRLFPGVFWTWFSSFGPPADALILLDRLPRQDYLVLEWVKREPDAVCPWADPRLKASLQTLHKLGRVKYP